MRRDHRQVGYVQSGLILHLDALLNMGAGNAHSNTTTTWYDLSATANNVSLVSPSWSNDYLTFTGSTRGQTGSNLNLSGYNKCTIEILIRTLTNTTLGILLEQTTNYNNNVVAFITYFKDAGYDNIFSIRKTGALAYLVRGITQTFSDDVMTLQYDDTTNVAATENEHYINSVLKTSTQLVGNSGVTTDTNLISSILYIGARSGGTFPFIGSIRAIRIYNRKLSVAELYQNKITDFRRYGIIK